MNSESQTPLKNWVPLRIRLDLEEPLVEWLFVSEKTFTEPFFEDTVSAIKNANGNRKSFRSVSTLEMILEWSRQIKPISPSALVFHVSRCGSTLLSQMLCLDPANIVLSEVPLFDELLRMPFKTRRWTMDDKLKYLLAATRFYGQKRTTHQQQLFIKTDSWHLHFYEALRKAFPDVPFILLYRHPAPVLQSQQKKRGLHAVPGMIEPELFDLSAGETNLDLHLVRVLSSYYVRMILIIKQDLLAFPFNYNAGIPNLVKEIYTFTGRQITRNLEHQIELRSHYHAKEPSQLFSGDDDTGGMPALMEPAINLYKQLDSASIRSVIHREQITKHPEAGV